jgi:hypothetical protein
MLKLIHACSLALDGMSFHDTLGLEQFLSV